MSSAVCSGTMVDAAAASTAAPGLGRGTWPDTRTCNVSINKFRSAALCAPLLCQTGGYAHSVAYQSCSSFHMSCSLVAGGTPMAPNLRSYALGGGA